MEADKSLREFCGHYGFDFDLLSGADPYRIEGAEAGFDGHIDVIRLTEHGRFGNIFYQILNAVFVARQLACERIEVFKFRGGPSSGVHLLPGLAIECADRFPPPATPTLVGHFFNSYAFQSALTGFGPSTLVSTIDDIMRPLFGQLLDAADTMPDTDDVLVMNVRGGDVFRTSPPPAWYVQPPVSYYVMAADFAREQLGISKVLFIAEDDANPTLRGTILRLRKAGFSVDLQMKTFEDDMRTLLSARHLVSPHGTLCEALAMLSRRLKTYVAFRQFESHRHLHVRRRGLIVPVLKAHGVRPVRIRDAAGDYIAPRTWDGDPAQLSLMLSYELDRLSLDDLTVRDDTTDDCYEDFADIPIMSAAEEAHKVRHRLALVQQDLRDMQASRDQLSRERDALAAELDHIKGMRLWRLARFLHRTSERLRRPRPPEH